MTDSSSFDDTAPTNAPTEAVLVADVGSPASRRGRVGALAMPSLLIAGGLGALSLARDAFQKSRLFVPDRYPNGVWNPVTFGLPAEDVWFHSDDGEDLHGWWIPQPRRRAKGTLLYCHGNTGSIAHQVGDLLHLRRLGMNLLAFDYRGYGRSSGKPSEKGLFKDVRAAYAYLVDELEQAPESIYLFGHSLGGAVAIDAARDCRVAGLITLSTFTDVRDAARGLFPTLPLHLAARRQFASIDKVAHLDVPKLFVHGAEDGMLPPVLAERLHEAAASPKEIYIVPRAGHNDVHRHGGLAYLRRLSRFCSSCR